MPKGRSRRNRQMGAYLRSVDEIRPHLPVSTDPHAIPRPATGRLERISGKPTPPSRSNPRIRTHLNGTGKIRTQPPASVPPAQSATHGNPQIGAQVRDAAHAHQQEPADGHGIPTTLTGYARICRFPRHPTPSHARLPADGNASRTCRRHLTTTTLRYGHTSTAPAKYASNRRFPQQRHGPPRTATRR